MSYNVFLTAYIGAPRDHHAIFVETAADGSGYIFQVTGDIQNGMRYEYKESKKPETSASFSSKKTLGQVAATDWDRIGELCSKIPPPKKQFQGSKRLFPKEPLRRCQDWTQEAIHSLTSAGVLQTASSITYNDVGESSSSKSSKMEASNLTWRTNDQTNCAEWWDGKKWVKGDWSEDYQKWYAQHNGQWYYW